MDMLFIKGKYSSKYWNLCLLKISVFAGISIAVGKNNGPCKNDVYIPYEWLNYGDFIL